MLHIEFGIQIQQGWQYLHYCQNAIEKKLFFISTSYMFCMYTIFGFPPYKIIMALSYIYIDAELNTLIFDIC